MLVNTIRSWGEELKNEGKIIGIEEGRRLGVVEGRRLGVKETSMISTEKMLKKNLTWDLITDITGVTQERYNQWEKSREAVMSGA